MKDYTEQNFENINLIRLHNMTVEEVVLAERQVESQFHKYRGVWWRKVKPFFYAPACFSELLVPGVDRPNPFLALGGYYHLVSAESLSNGSVIVNELTNQPEFKFDFFQRKVRYEIRHGLKKLQIRQITDLDHLLTEGYEVFLDWEKRTQDVFLKRSQSATFRRWTEKIFRHPYNIIVGAYIENSLIAYIIFKATGSVAELTKMFSKKTYHHCYPNPALLFSYLYVCSQNPAIEKIWNGFYYKKSLEQFKLRFGFKHVHYPAYIHLRSFPRLLAQYFYPKQFNRLFGLGH